MNEHDINTGIERSADAIRSADALLIGAGAGMGIDSGLPDFRGNTGFWAAYPPFEKLRLSFVQIVLRAFENGGAGRPNLVALG